MEYIPLWERDARREGKIEGKKETAKQMLKGGFDVDTIIEITGLKKEEIEKLAPQSH